MKFVRSSISNLPEVMTSVLSDIVMIPNKRRMIDITFHLAVLYGASSQTQIVMWDSMSQYFTEAADNSPAVLSHAA